MAMTDFIIGTLQERWKPSHDAFKPTFVSAVGIVERINVRSREVNANTAWSDQGKADEMKKFAGTQRAICRKVRSDLADAKAALQASRESLIPRSFDKSDVASAALRSEIRTFVRGMKPGERYAWLSDQKDPTVITAMWESFPTLSGLDDRGRDVVTQNWLKANRPKEIAAIEERAEAIEVLDVAVNVASGAVFTAAGERGDRAESWLEGSS